MKKLLKPASYLFYILVILLAFFTGALLAATFGAAEGQGLAGGAIILIYGAVTAFSAFAAALVLVYFIPGNIVVQLNKLLFTILVFIAVMIIMRIKQSRRNDVQITDTKTTVVEFQKQ